MNLLPRLLLVTLLIAGCAGPADPDPHAQEQLHTVAAPLLAAHARLDAYAAAVAGGGDYARARSAWPGVAADVEQAVDTFEVAAASSLGPVQRATLVGYVGGLRTAHARWEQVDAAIRARQIGAAADVGDHVAVARAHMRYLDGLRAGAFKNDDDEG